MCCALCDDLLLIFTYHDVYRIYAYWPYCIVLTIWRLHIPWWSWALLCKNSCQVAHRPWSSQVGSWFPSRLPQLLAPKSPNSRMGTPRNWNYHQTWPATRQVKFTKPFLYCLILHMFYRYGIPDIRGDSTSIISAHPPTFFF